ncbi:MAG: hypothetical protein AMXMBFR82_20760 [Candidatus Hydrogenedentota bacterium]
MKTAITRSLHHALKTAPVALALVLTAILAGTGCPKPAPEGIPVIDLAVGDGGLDFDLKGGETSEFEYAKVLLYFNVLKGDNQQDPDVILSGENIPELEYPISTVLTPHDLYVSDLYSENVLIWRDYRSLSAKADVIAAPDVILSAESTFDEPVQILVEDNRLFVADYYFDEKKACCGAIAIFDDAAGITEDRFPDVVLDDPGTPNGIAYADDQLYVADSSQDRVLVYTSVSDILEEDDKGLLDPEIVELSGPSWLNLDDEGPVIPLKVDVFDNHLYVTTATNFLFVFSPADALVDFQEPDAVIAQSNGALETPFGSQLVGDRLFVANLNAPFLILTKDAEAKSNSIGMVAFENATDLLTGQLPSLAFDTTHAQIPAVQDLVAEGDVLFVATSVPEENVPFKSATKAPYFGSFYPVGDVHIYRNADAVSAKRPGDIVLPALKDFLGPLSIDTNRQFTGL